MFGGSCEICVVDFYLVLIRVGVIFMRCFWNIGIEFIGRKGFFFSDIYYNNWFFGFE